MLDLNHKIHQLIICRLQGDDLSDPSYREKIFDLVRKGIGGFIVFGGDREETRDFIHSLQSSSDIPLFIASDIERGAGQQFNGATTFPSEMAIAAAIDRKSASGVQMLENCVMSIAEEAVDIGVNMPLIPVLDVNLNPDNPIICTRAFSDDPETVAWFGGEYIEILKKAGLICCAKHFPGHGDTAVDSHISLPVISKSEDDLMLSELVPFKKAIKSDVDSIMTGHLSIPSIDSVPATLSEKVITGLLRDKLGYKGLVMTDALNMSALNEFDNIPVKSIDAGTDILLHPADPLQTAAELLNAVKTKMIGEDKIESAFKRVMKCKAGLKTFGRLNTDYKEHKNIAGELFETSVTLVLGKSNFYALKNMSEADHVFTGDENKTDLSVLKQQTPGVVHINDYKIRENRKTIISLFTTVAAWQGSSGISDEDREKINRIIDKAGNSIVISFGSPYALRYFKKADMLIAAYDPSGFAQKAVFKCLKAGDFRGSLPVKIGFL